VTAPSGKRGLGLIRQGGQTMVWGKGAVAGGLVFLSGAEARSDETDEPVAGVAAQTELALQRIKERLAEAGARLEDIVKLVWYLRDRESIDEFYAARDGWLERNCPELVRERSYASTLLIVGLAKEDMLVEIDCIALAGGLESSNKDRIFHP
jgi:enamine deaminase RidA (YjgF/YER057c/UK114 family)